MSEPMPEVGEPNPKHVAIPDPEGPCRCVGCVGYASDRDIDYPTSSDEAGGSDA